MIAPHYSEIIDAVNRLNRGITFYDGNGYIGQDVYRLFYTVGYKVGLTEQATIAVYTNAIQLCPDLLFHPFLKIDRRKRKKFKFEDYGTVEDLASDFSGYVLDAVDNYVCHTGIVKSILKKQDRRALKFLRAQLMKESL